MSKTKSKIAPPESLKDLGSDILDYVKTKGTKEDIKYFQKELDEMEKMVKEGLEKIKNKS